MSIRVIAVYLEEKAEYGSCKGVPRMFTKIQMNHAYNKRFEEIRQRTGDKKTQLARIFLMSIFKTHDVSELKEVILYSAGFDPKKIALVCKSALKKAIDSYQLST